jgi:hypothetical protein
MDSWLNLMLEFYLCIKCVSFDGEVQILAWFYFFNALFLVLFNILCWSDRFNFLNADTALRFEAKSSLGYLPLLIR